MNEVKSKSDAAFDPFEITRPDPALWTYYLIICACTLIAFPIAIWPHYFKYHTLRYRFDDKGISMSWGILFRKEIYLTYRRIQDIHVTRNIIQRWLGLATVAVQTASGTAGAEMKIEGMTCAPELRDFLYRKMRGAEDGESVGAESGEIEMAPAADSQMIGSAAASGEAISLLHEIRDELRGLRLDLLNDEDAPEADGEA